MSHLQEHLTKVKESGKKILVPFFTGGYPDGETFIDLLLKAQEAGADGVEVGIPFSDPAADGPIIQLTSQKALEAGVTVTSIFELVKKARVRGLTIPLLYMTYFNPILHMGCTDFAEAAAASGADGVLVVDFPPEEADEFAPAARAAGLDTVFLVAPTTPATRFPSILKECSGFLYCVSVAGVTGEKRPVTEVVGDMVSKVRPSTDLPMLVGFGVTNGEAAAALAKVSDGVIVGSALLERIGELVGDEAVEVAGKFLDELRLALG